MVVTHLVNFGFAAVVSCGNYFFSMKCRGVFRTLSTIYDAAFWQIS